LPGRHRDGQANSWESNRIMTAFSRRWQTTYL
jgi:hypothetical protein